MFTTFWMPLETFQIELCDMLSKYFKFDSVRIPLKHVIINYKNVLHSFDMIFPDREVKNFLREFISEWELFKSVFPFIPLHVI